MKTKDKAHIQHLMFQDRDPENIKYLMSLKCALESFKDQAVNAHGIELTLVIENVSNSELHLLNPLEILQVVLLDGKGFPVALPIASPPRVLVNQRGPYHLSLPFKVIDVERNVGGQPLGSKLDYSTEDISFPANSSTRVTLGIDRIRIQQSTNALHPLPPDHYHLNVLLTLISHQGEYASRVCETGSFEVNYHPKTGCLAAILAFFKRLFGK